VRWNACAVALPSGPRLRALDMLAEELFAAHLGQGLDLALGSDAHERALPSGHYVLLARAKTGALVRIAARLGAIAAGADAAIEAALAEWASELGVAYQIRNDVADLANGMLDVAAGRPTYPLLLVLERDDRAAATLRRHLGRGLLSRSEHRRLRTLFVRERLAERAGAGGRTRCGSRARRPAIAPADRGARPARTHDGPSSPATRRTPERRRSWTSTSSSTSS
jgi:geranylgeranyl pyrophosphate synthase